MLNCDLALHCEMNEFNNVLSASKLVLLLSLPPLCSAFFYPRIYFLVLNVPSHIYLSLCKREGGGDIRSYYSLFLNRNHGIHGAFIHA